MNPPDDDVLTSTGVSKVSADSNTEGPGNGTPGRGSGVAGGEQGESDPAPPQALETDESRAAQGTASGQQLEVGEG